jgi:uroporphyrinogen decarboxylase
MPRYLRINEHLRKHGVDVISLDSDGNIDALLPLVIEAGFTQICPMEQAAGTDMLAIRKEYGNALAMMGGIDKRELSKGRKEIEAEVHRQAPELLEGGGYVPTVDHSVPPDVSYDSWMYYLDVKRRLVYEGV